MASLSLISFYLLLIWIFWGAHGVNVQLYMHNNFTGLFWQTNSTATCYDVGGFENSLYTKSIRTDTCLIAYLGNKCGPWTSWKVTPSEDPNTNSNIQSFRICNEEEDGGQLNIDITNTNYLNDRSNPHVVLESYRNVCSCINVPKYVQNMDKWAIQTYHSEVWIYFEPNCSDNFWNSMFLESSFWYNRNFIYQLKKTNYVTNATYKVQSLGPDPKSSYFKLSCTPNKVTTKVLKTYERVTETLKDVSVQKNNAVQTGDISTTSTSTDYSERTTESLGEFEVDAIGNKQVQQLSSNKLKLEEPVDLSKQSQDSFEARILKQQQEFFNMFIEKMTELQQSFRNFTEKIKFDLQEMCG